MSGILVVDDDPTIRSMFSRALSGLAEIETASNGGEALRMLGAKKFALVLLDLHMPVIDGFVVLQALATKPGVNKDTPVYVVTADMSEQARVRALKRHAVFFLTKPVAIATLTMLVDMELKKAAKAAEKAASEDRESSPTPAPISTPTPAPISTRAVPAAKKPS